LIQPAIVNSAAAIPVAFLFIATKPRIARAALTESILETATGPKNISDDKNAQLALVPENIPPLFAGRTKSKTAAVFSTKTRVSQETS
jgi:hypothetical protein